MLLFFYIILIIFIISLILSFSEIKLIIEDFEISKNFETSNLKKWNVPNYRGILGLYFLGKIKLFSIKINNDKTKKILKKDSIKEKIQNAKKLNKYQSKEKIEIAKKALKNLIKEIKIKTFNLKICIDTKNVILTSYLVAVISTIIPNLIRNNIKKFNPKNHSFEVFPLYKNQNYIYIKFNCIFSIKVVHIINMFKVMGGKKNEGSSNRGFNVNCYGKY